jgi:hypothetical protein
MTEEIIPVAVFIMLAVGALGLFGYLAVASWADARRRERESFYRSETLKKIAELQGAGVNAAVELFREQERALAKKAREGQKLAGLLTIGVGIGLMVFLKGVGDHEPAYLVGLIPTLAGVALLVYAYLLGPKD